MNVQTKHGKGKPKVEDLVDFQLAWSTKEKSYGVDDGKKLYIREGDEVFEVTGGLLEEDFINYANRYDKLGKPSPNGTYKYKDNSESNPEMFGIIADLKKSSKPINHMAKHIGDTITLDWETINPAEKSITFTNKTGGSIELKTVTPEYVIEVMHSVELLDAKLNETKVSLQTVDNNLLKKMESLNITVKNDNKLFKEEISLAVTELQETDKYIQRQFDAVSTLADSLKEFSLQAASELESQRNRISSLESIVAELIKKVDLKNALTDNIADRVSVLEQRADTDDAGDQMLSDSFGALSIRINDAVEELARLLESNRLADADQEDKTDANKAETDSKIDEINDKLEEQEELINKNQYANENAIEDINRKLD